MAGALTGFTIGVTGARRAEEQIELLERRGADVRHGPTIEVRGLTDGPALRATIEALIRQPPDLLVAITAVGLRAWMEAADGLGRGEELRAGLSRAEVLARGPKAAGALLAADLPPHWRADGERVSDVLDHLARRDLRGIRIAVQRDGAGEAHLVHALAARGAEVVDVAAYRWQLPGDLTAAHRLIDALADRQLDAITVTSTPALSNLLHLIDARPDADALRAQLADQVLVACVGPVCSTSARAAGIHRTIEPQRFRLGSMVKRLTDVLASTAWSTDIGAAAVQVQGAHVVVDGSPLRVPRREQLVLAALAEAAGGVVSKVDLARRGWGPGTDVHVVEVTVNRLRSRLGPAAGLVVTVPRRGYRLASPPRPAGRGPGQTGQDPLSQHPDP